MSYNPRSKTYNLSSFNHLSRTNMNTSSSAHNNVILDCDQSFFDEVANLGNVQLPNPPAVVYVDMLSLPVTDERINYLEQRQKELNQALAQAEINLLKAQVRMYKAALERIADLDPHEDSNEVNEWAEAECFNKAQNIAHITLKPIPAINKA